MKITNCCECAQALKEIRAHMPINLDPAVLFRLDDVIKRLEQAKGADDVSETSRYGLEVLGQVVEFAVSVLDLLNLFGN